MVIVAGHVRVDPEQREAYLAGCVGIVEKARAAVGCLDCSIGGDLVDTGRVNIFERWASPADLDAHRRDVTDDEQRPPMRSVSVLEYDIARERPLFDG